MIKAIEGDKIFTRCGIGLSWCSDSNPCPIYNDYSAIRQQYLQLASEITVEILADKIIAGEGVLNRLTFEQGG